MKTMRVILFLLALSVITDGCSSSKNTGRSVESSKPYSAYSYTGGHGTSFSDAVVIMATSSGEGVDSEYAWISQHVPGASVTRQSLVENGGKKYDVIDVMDALRQKRSIYFNIDHFFGKW